MRPNTRTAVVAALAIVVPIATASATAAGGLSIGPAVLETVAQTGRVGAITVANTSSTPMRLTVRARPWRQLRSGAVVSDGRRTLSGVRVSPSSFTLAPGQRRSVDVRLLRRPSGGSLYGNVEVTGTPPRSRRKAAIRTRYRLIAGLRLNPPATARRLKVRVGRIRAGAKGTLMALRNAGNTVTPVAGSARIVGGSGTVRTAIADTRVLPGRTVDINLRSGRLLPGRYVVSVALRQGGTSVATVKRRLTVR